MDDDLIARLKETKRSFTAATPADLDPEVLSLCRAMNAFPGIFTVESCCGHDREPFRIWFKAESLEVLPDLLWFFDRCHNGLPGWQVVALTDCSAGPVTFMAEGPRGAYEAAENIAKIMREEIAAGSVGDREDLAATGEPL